MRFLFTVTLFLSSALLFLIQPMIAKMILPRFGGSPGVWNTSMVFFQAALLIGYGYAHLSIKKLGAMNQRWWHVGLLLLTVLTLPIAVAGSMIWREGTGGSIEVLLVLALSVGAPFTVVSAGAPIIQRWFATTSDPLAKDPYFLYSASNIGSMLSLLLYPTVIEPNFTLHEQTRLWTYLFYLLVALMIGCAFTLHRSSKASVVEESPTLLPPAPEAAPEVTTAPIDTKRRLRWIALAFCPSSLMLGVTTYLTSNIAPIPLLWIIPLALYLLTFIIAFARRQVISPGVLGRILPLLVLPLGVVIVLESTQYMLLMSGFHLIVFFVAALMCHGALAADRPESEHLTEFFLLISVGGVLGGIFNALLAPLLFHTVLEYPLALCLACALRTNISQRPFSPKTRNWDYLYPALILIGTIVLMFLSKRYIQASAGRTALAIGLPLVLCFFAVDRSARFGASLAATFVAATATQINVFGQIIEAHRSFYGLHRVTRSHTKYGWYHTLTNGNTIHGMENMDGPFKGMPLTYYHPSGPMGDVFKKIADTRTNVALVGLGVGSLAGYGQPGQNFTYYELDPDVIKIASDHKIFTFVSDCKANLKIQSGDARLTLNHAPDHSIDLLVLDAFSSDSIPVHLLTLEAFKMYLRKLGPEGVLAVHISNRYLDLGPIVGRIALELNLAVLEDIDGDADLEIGKTASRWITLSPKIENLQPLMKDPDWSDLSIPAYSPLWTDDYSNLLGAFRRGDE